MSYKNEVIKKIAHLKVQQFGKVKINGTHAGVPFTLVLLTEECEENPYIISLLSKWRKNNMEGFFAIFNVTDEGTKRWFKAGLLDQKDRLLFLVKIKNCYIGHVGLWRFDFNKKTCEIDNIVRGEKGYPGIMESAIASLHEWGKTVFNLKHYMLQVASDNLKAIKLYQRLGYKEVKRTPLIQVKTAPDRIEWVEAPGNFKDKIIKFNVCMGLNK